MYYPKIKFIPCGTEDQIVDFMNSNGDAAEFLVYLKYKYAYESKYKEDVFGCSPYGLNGIMWNFDWNEGYDDIIYIAIAAVRC